MAARISASSRRSVRSFVKLMSTSCLVLPRRGLSSPSRPRTCRPRAECWSRSPWRPTASCSDSTPRPGEDFLPPRTPSSAPLRLLAYRCRSRIPVEPARPFRPRFCAWITLASEFCTEICCRINSFCKFESSSRTRKSPSLTCVPSGTISRIDVPLCCRDRTSQRTSTLLELSIRPVRPPRAQTHRV